MQSLLSSIHRSLSATRAAFALRVFVSYDALGRRKDSLVVDIEQPRPLLLHTPRHTIRFLSPVTPLTVTPTPATPLPAPTPPVPATPQLLTGTASLTDTSSPSAHTSASPPAVSSIPPSLVAVAPCLPSRAPSATPRPNVHKRARSPSDLTPPPRSCAPPLASISLSYCPPSPSSSVSSSSPSSSSADTLLPAEPAAQLDKRRLKAKEKKKRQKEKRKAAAAAAQQQSDGVNQAAGDTELTQQQQTIELLRAELAVAQGMLEDGCWDWEYGDGLDEYRDYESDGADERKH